MGRRGDGGGARSCQAPLFRRQVSRYLSDSESTQTDHGAIAPQQWRGGNGGAKTNREGRYRGGTTGPALLGMSVPYPVKIALALRSGNRCAMPSCRQLLSSEPRDDEYVMLGVAAHIAGERGGGTRGRPSARFDSTMSSEQRNSLANLLYVCQNCHAKIDAHPHGEREYPVERLLEIKSEHEKTVAAAMGEALAAVTFVELAEATRWVTEVPPPPPARDFSRVAIEDKIQRNGLTLSSQNLIAAHLAVAPQVRSFIQVLSRDDPGFPDRLKSGFLQHYHGLRAQGRSSGEDLFNSMCMFARRGFGDPKTQCAAQAVLVYLFETCEVFER